MLSACLDALRRLLDADSLSFSIDLLVFGLLRGSGVLLAMAQLLRFVVESDMHLINLTVVTFLYDDFGGQWWRW